MVTILKAVGVISKTLMFYTSTVLAALAADLPPSLLKVDDSKYDGSWIGKGKPIRGKCGKPVLDLAIQNGKVTGTMLFKKSGSRSRIIGSILQDNSVILLLLKDGERGRTSVAMGTIGKKKINLVDKEPQFRCDFTYNIKKKS